MNLTATPLCVHLVVSYCGDVAPCFNDAVVPEELLHSHCLNVKVVFTDLNDTKLLPKLTSQLKLKNSFP